MVRPVAGRTIRLHASFQDRNAIMPDVVGGPEEVSVVEEFALRRSSGTEHRDRCSAWGFDLHDLYTNKQKKAKKIRKQRAKGQK